MARESVEHFRDKWHNPVRTARRIYLQDLWIWLEQQPGFYYIKAVTNDQEIWMFTDPQVAFEFRMRFT